MPCATLGKLRFFGQKRDVRSCFFSPPERETSVDAGRGAPIKKVEYKRKLN